MKKIFLLSAVLLAFSFTSLSALSVGFIGNSNFGDNNGASLTIGIDDLELEIDVIDIGSVIHLSADWKLAGDAIGDGFFWDFAAGVYVSISDNYLGLGVIAPFEFGYTFDVASGLDLYLQVMPAVSILESVGFDWHSGLGLRLFL